MRRSIFLLAFAVLALALPSTAWAGAPLAATGSATAVSDTAATLNGTVGPNKETTNYHFEYGTTAAYGTSSAITSAGSGNSTKSVTASIGSLAPLTTYHFRLVAVNPSGTATGADMTFTTLAIGAVTPTPTVTLFAAPSTLIWGAASTLTATLTNMVSNASQSVDLRENPYPFSAGFKTVATGTSDAAGKVSFIRNPTTNTQYQAIKRTGSDVTSGVVQVNVRPKITLSVSDRTPRKGQKVRFRGTVSPAHNARILYIQRRTSSGRYKTIGQVALAPVAGGAKSSFVKRLRIRVGGLHRVLLKSHEDHVAGTKRSRLKVH